MIRCLLLIFTAQVATSKTITPFVLDSEDATPAEFPWMVSVHYGDWAIGANHYCGGILVDPEWVLTSGRCVDNDDTMSVTAGAHIRTLAELQESAQTSAIQRKVFHQGYCGNCVEYPYDLVMLQMATPFDVSGANISVAQLPDDDEDVAGEECVISGWGRPTSGLQQSDILRKASTTGMNINACRESLATREIWEYNSCYTNAENTVGLCDGDRGGPMNCPSGDGMVVKGIASWWVTCQAPLQPSVFVRTGYFKSWIDGVMSA
ncbi:hypothetical protein CAPTEDRAFT_151454 [Capitella teleta]|uniref:Peptidase S1 domain-containing protein n=1 Tax=Capitella teleta TaxID=283909 RepID=R7V729_CAPTE|nr:hypothetical protein CAPTEDRAFT_151454 [Capitella teleta]|eukprot:ELU14252.1 hypothetical protein CAPTEDRAFT_151454 [Capitella teleta]